MDFARSADAAVQTQLDRLGAPTSAADTLGLDRIEALLARLGRPQDALPPVIHVAGTNGKGSTCAFLRSMIEAAGQSVHAFTSPHLVRFNERVRVAGRLIDDEPLAALLAEVLDCSEDIAPSFFEAAAAAALLAFARSPADACILEVGLGGRLDATNVVDRPLATAITDLGIDHQHYLGRRLADIAGEKAAIAKRGVPLVTQLYPRRIADRIGEVAGNAGARWLPRGGQWHAAVGPGELRYRDMHGNLDLPLPRLPGRHQAMNAALAVAILRHQHVLDVPLPSLSAGIGWAHWPARLQRLADGPLTAGHDEVWLDGGHNPSAARGVAAFIRGMLGDGRPLHLVFASLASKDAPGILRALQGLVAEVHAVPIPGHACFAPEALVALASSLGFDARSHADARAALAAIPGDARVLIFGSLYLAGSVLSDNGEEPD